MLSGKQIKVIEYLCEGKTQADAARLLHIHPNTVTRWLRDTEFKCELRKANEDTLNVAAIQAVDVICKLMKDADSETVQLNAAKDILSRAGYDAENKQRLLADEPVVIRVGIDD